jgi:DMSO/TMAO reductase YedYZ molybdopterin-dependent catalytic subunit
MEDVEDLAMRKTKSSFGFLVGALLGMPLVVITGLAASLLGLGFPPFLLFNWITRVLPGPLVTLGIDLLIDTLRTLRIDVADAAKTAEQAMAILFFLFLFTLMGGIVFVVFNRWRIKPNFSSGLIVGAITALPFIAIDFYIPQPAVHPLVERMWLALVFLAWGALLSLAYRQLSLIDREPLPTTPEDGSVERIDRRKFLITMGLTSATITVVGTGLAAVLSSAQRTRKSAEEQLGGQGPALPNLDDPIVPAPGTRPEYTPIEDHYKVFIQLLPSGIDEKTWTLPITGLVDNPLTLTLKDLRQNFNAREQFVTLSCISGRVGTTLIGTTHWKGASLQEVLATAQPQSEARYLHIRSVDGFFETVDMDLIDSDERIMLCYDWDGKPLPDDHGFPLRIWLPDRFGMKQPKWITSIEVSDQYVPGYWVERGWDEVAQVQATSVIDTVAVDSTFEHQGQTLIPIGGIAFSGAREISRVEVRVDGGDWREAQLRSPLSETTWVIWRFDWSFEPGEHTFEVRCFEGDGKPQIATERSSRPSGARGIHSETEIIASQE